jgi:hypothetical protein
MFRFIFITITTPPRFIFFIFTLLMLISLFRFLFSLILMIDAISQVDAIRLMMLSAADAIFAHISLRWPFRHFSLFHFFHAVSPFSPPITLAISPLDFIIAFRYASSFRYATLSLPRREASITLREAREESFDTSAPHEALAARCAARRLPHAPRTRFADVVRRRRATAQREVL